MAAEPAPAAQGAAAQREAFENLTAAEADLLEAIVARLIPSDAIGPGAREARAAHYIDRALGGALASSRQAYTAGLAALDRYARSSRGKAFLELVRHRSGLGADRRRNRGAPPDLRRQLRRVLRAGAEPHAAGHVRRSVLRRQRELRRLGSDRLPGRPDDGDGRRSEGARSGHSSSRITSRRTTSRGSTKRPRACEPHGRRHETWRRGSRTPTS